MEIKRIDSQEYERLYFVEDMTASLRAFIAIHSTTLGPAIGGCRFLPYVTLEAALLEACFLAKSMTYKCALANVPHGGGKAVIIQPPGNFSRENLFRAFGRCVHVLAGSYITAIDSGSTQHDMQYIARETPHVVGYRENENPSYYTAQGIIQALRAACEHRYGSAYLSGKTVLVKGVGSVGSFLVPMLCELGACVSICDINKERVHAMALSLDVHIVDFSSLLEYSYDILCPCDTGYTVTYKNIDTLDVAIIAGATNNQLEDAMLATRLTERGILYCPDYVVNAGGLMYVSALYQGQTTLPSQQLENIYHTMQGVLQRAAQQKATTLTIAQSLGESLFKCEPLQAVI